MSQFTEDILEEAKLTTKARKALPKSDFALPEKEAYPVEDKTHAYKALQLGAKFATSEEYAKIKAKVKSKFPDIKQSE